MCLAIPGKILSISGEESALPVGKVSFGGAIREVNLAFVPEARVGEYVIVHVGFAISILNEEEAVRVLDTLDELGSMPTEDPK